MYILVLFKPGLELISEIIIKNFLCIFFICRNIDQKTDFFSVLRNLRFAFNFMKLDCCSIKFKLNSDLIQKLECCKC